ncbi:MAG: glycosyltransferase 87 family protein [bacterium]|nr:glycosyltransferase 87 family protein [bacterium]
MNKGFVKLLVLAIFLRLLVSAFLFHPDIKTYNFQASFLKKGVINIYSYLINNKATLPIKEEFVYFPLTYFTVGGYQAVISSFLGPDFNTWLTDAGSNSMVNNLNIFKYLILLKLPLFIMDISIAFLLLKFFKDKKDGKNAFTLWLFNPFTIILIYAFSNIDLYAVLLSLIAFFYIKRDKLIKASVFIGLAASFKLYPILFVPFLLMKAKTTKEKVLSVLVPVLTLFVVIVPFWSPAFVESALVSGLSTRIFSPGFPIGFGESIVVGLFLLSSLFFTGWIFGKKIKLFNYFVTMLLVIFSFSHFHISWLLWISPFLVILAVSKPTLKWLIFFWAIFAISIPLFYSDRSMTISLFRIYTNWYDFLPTPFIITQKFYDPYNFQSILHSVLAGLSVAISIKLLGKENKIK